MTKHATTREGGTVQSIERALSLLEALEDSRGEVGIAELSKRVGLHVSTVHRILATLVARGYARQSPETSRYALGARTLHLAESYLGQVDVRRVAHPVLEQLSHETGETANLVILDRQEALYLDKVESPQSLRIFSRIGRRAPLHCTAVGKVLLARRPRSQVDALLGPGPLERLTKHTLTSISQVRRELEKVREQGFALDREECEEGACCIAVPIYNSRGDVEAAIGISAPTTRLTPRRVEELIPIMLRTGREVSAQLGFGGSSR
ncbi:MAG TPA: IclR family transcriptional regulator [Candidatus Methylomirabilis sp.]|nr:IclR family transcriptional regulator [Candidatus Methylomirabilis sp.]